MAIFSGKINTSTSFFWGAPCSDKPAEPSPHRNPTILHFEVHQLSIDSMTHRTPSRKQSKPVMKRSRSFRYLEPETLQQGHLQVGLWPQLPWPMGWPGTSLHSSASRWHRRVGQHQGGAERYVAREVGNMRNLEEMEVSMGKNMENDLQKWGGFSTDVDFCG